MTAIEIGGSLYVISVVALTMAASECDPDDFCYLGRRVGEKGIVTLCRVPFVIAFIPFIFIVLATIDIAPERGQAKEWLFEEREEA